MSIEVSALRRLQMETEAAGSFAVDVSDTGVFKDVPAIEGSMTVALTREMLDPQSLQQKLYGVPIKLPGRKSASLTFALPLAPTGVAADDGTAQVQGAVGELLAAIMGGENLQTGSANTGAQTVSLLSISNRGARNFAVGSTVGYGASGSLELREIESVVNDAALLKVALSTAPATDAVVYGAAGYYLTGDPNTSLQFIAEGAETGDRWLLLGGQATSVAFEFPINEIPKATITVEFADYKHGSDAASVLTGVDLGVATYSNWDPIRVDGELLAVPVGQTSLPDPLCVADFALAPAFKFQAVKCPSGTNGVARYRVSRVGPAVTGTFQTTYEDQTWFDARDTQARYGLFFQLGATAGEAVLVSIPTAQIMDVQPSDMEGLSYQTVTWEAQLDADVGSSTDALALSPFRIHFA